MTVLLALVAVCLIHLMGQFFTVFFAIPMEAYPGTHTSSISTCSESRVFSAFSSMVPHAIMHWG